jgi:hypothetical protein
LVIGILNFSSSLLFSDGLGLSNNLSLLLLVSSLFSTELDFLVGQELLVVFDDTHLLLELFQLFLLLNKDLLLLLLLKSGNFGGKLSNLLVGFLISLNLVGEFLLELSLFGSLRSDDLILFLLVLGDFSVLLSRLDLHDDGLNLGFFSLIFLLLLLHLLLFLEHLGLFGLGNALEHFELLISNLLLLFFFGDLLLQGFLLCLLFVEFLGDTLLLFALELDLLLNLRLLLQGFSQLLLGNLKLLGNG